MCLPVASTRSHSSPRGHARWRAATEVSLASSYSRHFRHISMNLEPPHVGDTKPVQKPGDTQQTLPQRHMVLPLVCMNVVVAGLHNGNCARPPLNLVAFLEGQDFVV